MNRFRTIVLASSLQGGSANQALASAVKREQPGELLLHAAPAGDLPLYNQCDDAVSAGSLASPHGDIAPADTLVAGSEWRDHVIAAHGASGSGIPAYRERPS